MDWTPQQSAAIKAANAWLKQHRVKPRSTPQVFRLFGWAGTGKSTLAKEIAGPITAEGGADAVVSCAYTGKAALVMTKKGTPSRTLHSALYKALTNEATGEVTFDLNPDSPVATARLIIVDEVSMVDEEVGRDLESFGRPILVLGDPFQLQPVKGDGYFTAHEPNIMLTDIRRQAADNPIIRMSIDIREGRGLKPGDYGDSAVMRRSTLSADDVRPLVLDADQVLCGRNQTRQAYNGRMRRLKGYNEPMPMAGERLVCLKNDHTKGLLNGGLWHVVESDCNDNRKVKLLLDSLDMPVGAVPVEVLNEFFLGTEASLDWKQKRGTSQFTFGNVLTTHKAQGSQWDDVTVFDESHVFRDQAPNWLYTAVTRAAEKVTVIQ